jgi:hypothetical protein
VSGTGYLCAVIAGLSLAYAVEEARRLATRSLLPYVGRRQAARRVVGSVLVAVLMVLVDVGLEVIDPYQTPRRFVVLWGSTAMLTVLLLALAVLDLRELRANRDLAHTRDLLRRPRDKPTKEPPGEV